LTRRDATKTPIAQLWIWGEVCEKKRLPLRKRGKRNKTSGLGGGTWFWGGKRKEIGNWRWGQALGNFLWGTDKQLKKIMERLREEQKPLKG